MRAMQRLAIIDRGEPAMRCISAVAELNLASRAQITTIALCTQDTASAIVREANEALLLSPAAFAATGTRLDPVRLLAALTEARADALWAGWEFIADPAELASLCEREGITFIGPGSDVIRLLGDKEETRRLAERAGVPVAPRLAGQSTPGRAVRLVEVQVVADGLGTVWAIGVRDGSIRRGNSAGHRRVSLRAARRDRRAGVARRGHPAVRRRGLPRHRVGRVRSRSGHAEFVFTDFRIQPPSGHLVTELTTGLDLARLQLDMARGGRLTGSPAQARGHAIEVRLAAEDPEHAFATTPRRVAALRPPAGAGIRADVGAGEGDEITAGPGSVIATVAAWGRDRREALSRLRRGLAQSIAVVDGGTTNKALLLTLLDRPEIGAGSYDCGWLDRLTAAGEHLAPQHPVALLQGAIEAADSDQAAVQAAFFAAAARGRPELPADTGHQVELSLRGNPYLMTVYGLGGGHYRVEVGDSVIDANVRHLGRYERVVTCFGRRHRVVAGGPGPGLIVEVDGVPHVLARRGGSRVRAPAPAFVVAVEVAPGDAVRAGDPLVVVESMKMETAITAPFAGTVRAVLASVNTHVEAGTPLVQLQPEEDPGPHTPAAPRLRFAAAPDRAGPGDDGFTALRSYLLGYDVGDDAARELVRRREAMLDAVNPADSGLLGQEQELLEIFADLAALARREPDENEKRTRNTPAARKITCSRTWPASTRTGCPGPSLTSSGAPWRATESGRCSGPRNWSRRCRAYTGRSRGSSVPRRSSWRS